MLGEIDTEIAEMLDDDFPIPIEEGGEVESGSESVMSEEGVKTPVEEVVESTEEVEVSPVESKVEGTPEGGEPAKEEDGEKEVVVEETVVVAPVVEPVSEIDGLKAQVTTLMGLLNTAHQGTGSPQVQPESPPAAVASTAFNTFMEGVDFDSVMESKESFAKFFTQSMAIVSQQAEQNVMAAVPEYVSGQVQRNATMKNVADEFYSVNPELTAVKGYVATVAAEVSSTNPTWDMVQVLTKTAEMAKSTLGLVGVSEAVIPTALAAKTAPVLPGGTRTTKTPASKKTSLQSDIDDFLTEQS